MDPAPPPQGRSRHAISGHHRRHAPGPGAELHEGYGNRTGRNRLPARLLVTGSISTRVQTLDRRSTRAISPADETAKAGLKSVPSRASIRTRGGCSYNQYPALRFNARNRDLVLPVGAPHRCEPQSNRTSKPAPIRTRHGRSYNQYPALRFNTRKGIWRTCRSTAHGANRNQTEPQSQPPFAPDTGAPTISIRRWGSMPGMGSGFTPTSPASVRTAIEPRLRASPHSHPTRVLLQSISGVEVQYPGKGSGVPVGAPPRCEPQSNRTSEPAPIRTRHGCSYGGYGVVTFGVGAPPPGANWAGTHSHPARVLLQQIREFAPVAAAPTARRSRMPTPHISCASSTASSHSWARCSSSSSSYSFILFSPS